MARLVGYSIKIDPSFFRQIEEFIKDNEFNMKNARFGLDVLAQYYAYTILGSAQQRSAGAWGGMRLTGRHFIGAMRGGSIPVPHWSGGAWTMPVRRLTGAYWRGWYAERISLGIWKVSNTSREAYFIEYGINHIGTGLTDIAGNRVRVRRPVLKLSVLAAVKIAGKTPEDTNVLAKMFGVSGGIYHSPMLYSSSRAAARAYPVGETVMNSLQNIASGAQ